MDNITHSLLSVSLAEGTLEYRRARGETPSAVEARLLWLVSLISGSCADVDVFLSRITEGRLGYLIHRRGVTHALATLPVELGVLALFLWLSRKWMKKPLERRAWYWIVLLSSVNLVAHVLFDYANSYGIRLFWPFDSRWYYGDTLFIAEPWIWAVLMPPLLLSQVGRTGKAILTIISLMMLALFWLSGLLPIPVSAALTLASIAFLAIARRIPSLRRLLIGGALLAGLVFIFWASGRQARSRVLEVQSGEGTRLHDIVLTPQPGNPFCWSLFTVESYENGRYYRVRKGSVSLAPLIISAGRCFPSFFQEGTVTLLPTAVSEDESIYWAGEYRLASEKLSLLKKTHCQVAAFLRFARVPYVIETGKDLILGDFRFDRNRGLDFGEMQITKDPTVCPNHVPNWPEPRADLFH